MYIHRPDKRVRNVIHRGSLRVTGQFYSRKMNCGIQWESFLEEEFILLLEFYRHVIAYFAQPFRIEYYVGKRRHTYVPDFLVECRGNTFKIHEVKPEDEATKQDNIRKFSIVSQMYGKDFCVTTENFISQEPRLGNIKTLFRYLSLNPTTQDKLAILKILDSYGCVSIGDLMTGRHHCKFGMPTVYALIAQGCLTMDIFGKLNENTLVWLPGTADIIKSTQLFYGNDKTR